jgi:ubiquitin-conjugating enzyme E2 O
LKDGALAIVPETSLVLYQREFMRGDIVKRSLFDTQSAIVQSMYSEVRLEHVMTKQKLKEWIPFQSLKSSLVVQHRDTVVFENWIGTIEEVSPVDSLH